MGIRLLFAVLLSLPVFTFAAEKCSADDLLKKTCDFYKKNSDQEILKTSDGRSYRNPLYSKASAKKDSLKEAREFATNSDKSVTTEIQNTSSNPVNPEIMDLQLEHRLILEDVVDDFATGKWPKRTIRSLKMEPVLKALVLKEYPNDPCCKVSASSVFVPTPLDDPDGKMQIATPDQLEEIRKVVGKERIQKLRQQFQSHQQNYDKLLGKSGSNTIVNEFVKTETASTPKVNFEKENARIKNLAEYAREQVILLIKNGRSDSQLSTEQKNLIEKIKTIKYIEPQDPTVPLAGGCQTKENAAYLAVHHTLTICEGLYNMPDAQIVLAIAHEIGHSIDPCLSQSNLYKVDNDKVAELMRVAKKGSNERSNSSEEDEEYDQEGPVSEDDEERDTYLEALALIYKGTPDFTNAIDDRLAKQKIYAPLFSSGALTKVADSVPPAKHPFEAVRACLVREENIDAITDQDIQAEQAVLISLGKRQQSPYTKNELNKAKKASLNGRHCEGTIIKKAETQEAMGDFYGAFVQSRYLAEHPPKNETDAVGAISFFAEPACSETSEVDRYDSMLKLLRSGHPIGARRLASISLKMPGIAESFGCELKPKSNCFVNQEHLLKSSKVNSALSGGQQ